MKSWNRKESPSEPVAFGPNVTFAIVGCGDHANKFFHANRFSKQMEVVAVYGQKMEEVLEFAARKGRIVCFDDAQQLADWQEVDAVYISGDLSITQRSQMVLTMLKAGKHVLCHPPMASSIEKATELFDAAQEADCILMEALPALVAPAFEKMLPYLKSLGQVRHATLQNCQYSMDYEQYKHGIITKEFQQEFAGGALMELAVYPVSMMIHLFGKAQTLHAAGVTLSHGMNVSGSMLMAYEDMTGEVIYSKISESAMPSQIQGDQGSMLIQEITNIKDLRICRRKVDQVIHFEQSDNLMNHVSSAFIRMIHTRQGMEENKELSLATIHVLEEAAKQMNL